MDRKSTNYKVHITHHTSHNSGITIVALIITIIVLLILSVVAIQIMRDGGIIEKAKYSKEDYRGAKVQEQKELFEIELEMSKYDVSTENKINDLLNKLEEENLITPEERNTITETGRITIGTKEIIFQKGEILPKGYKRCEYLESTGTQYIDTNIVDEIGTKVYLSFCTTTNSGYQFMLTNGRTQIGLIDTRYGTTTARQDYVFEVDVKGDANILVTNKTNGKIFTNKFVGYNKAKMFLFALNDRGSSCHYTVARLYYAFFWLSDEKVGNFIPTLDQNGTPCMYDTVTKQTFYNQGTGEFIAGPIVE